MINSTAKEFMRIMHKVAQETNKYRLQFLRFDMRNSFYNMVGHLDYWGPSNDLRTMQGQLWSGRLQWPYHTVCHLHGLCCPTDCNATGTVWKSPPLVSKRNGWNWLKYLGHLGD